MMESIINVRLTHVDGRVFIQLQGAEDATRRELNSLWTVTAVAGMPAIKNMAETPIFFYTRKTTRPRSRSSNHVRPGSCNEDLAP